MASYSSAFPTGTTRRRSSFPAELPTLSALQERLPAAANLPIKDDPIIHEGAKAAHEVPKGGGGGVVGEERDCGHKGCQSKRLYTVTRTYINTGRQ